VTGPRSTHDVVVSRVRGTARGEVALVTSLGRCVRVNVLDLPTVPSTANAPNLQGGASVVELVTLEPPETVLGMTTLAPDSRGLALGTANGVVKRVNAEVVGKESWEVIRLEAGDRVVGAVELTSADVELVFVTSDAQLLHFGSEAVRPQGRSGGGIAGIKLSAGATVVFFGAVSRAHPAVLVSVSGSSAALPGTDAGSVKVTEFSDYPGKGRATAGVRCHRFLKGEDTLLLAWVGPAPAIAAAASGSPLDLPAADHRRDGTGVGIGQPVVAVSSRSTWERSSNTAVTPGA
jgi:DNA gyrase subunit A